MNMCHGNITIIYFDNFLFPFSDEDGLFYKYIRDFCIKFTQENNPRENGMAHEIRRCDIPIPMDIIDLPGMLYSFTYIF